MKLRKKLTAALLAATMVLGSGFSSLAAESYNFEPPTSPIKVDENIITASVHRAGSVLPEVLGLDTKCGFSLINGNMPSTLEEAKTKLMLGAFGTDANDVPDPYYYNYFYNFYAKENGLPISEDAILIPEVNVAASPVAADTNIIDEYGTSISLAGRPEILIGCSSANSGSDIDGYNEQIADIRNGYIGAEYYQEGDENYQPYLVSYTTTTTYDMVKTLNEVANVMNEITKETGKTGRYGDPSVIAESFGDYVCGVPMYILSELEKQGLEKKKVALLSKINDDGTFTIKDAAAQSATSSDRIVEYTALVADNIAADLGTTVTAEEILTADAFIIYGQGSSVDRDTFAEAVGGADKLAGKIVVAEAPNSVYGITMNSIENGMGYGYFDSYLYSDILDLNPAEWCAYFYENFYHVSNAASLQSITSNSFNDVILPAGISTDLSQNYNSDDIKAMLAQGQEYYYEHIDQFDQTALTKVWGTEEGSRIEGGFSGKYDTVNDETYANPFVDIDTDNYYFKSILWASRNGITSGVDATHFAPQDQCTRGQAVTFLWRLAGEPEPTATETKFVDVGTDTYYYDAILWAVEEGITSGVDATHFAPEETVTRGQIATFIYRYKVDEANAEEPAENPFVDVSEDSYYYKAILWAYENGVTYGVDETHFAPEDNCIRGDIVTFLYRANNVKEVSQGLEGEPGGPGGR